MRERKTRPPKGRPRKTRAPKTCPPYALTTAEAGDGEVIVSFLNGPVEITTASGLLWNCVVRKHGRPAHEVSIGRAVGNSTEQALNWFDSIWGNFGFMRPHKITPTLCKLTGKHAKRS